MDACFLGKVKVRQRICLLLVTAEEVKPLPAGKLMRWIEARRKQVAVIAPVMRLSGRGTRRGRWLQGQQSRGQRVQGRDRALQSLWQVGQPSFIWRLATI